MKIYCVCKANPYIRKLDRNEKSEKNALAYFATSNHTNSQTAKMFKLDPSPRTS